VSRRGCRITDDELDGWDLKRLGVHPPLVDAAERYLRSTDINLYKAELWAEYSGTIDATGRP
jgi:hypothetical protein